MKGVNITSINREASYVEVTYQVFTYKEIKYRDKDTDKKDSTQIEVQKILESGKMRFATSKTDEEISEEITRKKEALTEGGGVVLTADNIKVKKVKT
jgi:hypothetical protein